MAETEYATTAKLPVEVIWDFVKEMDNWAHLLTGYQGHVKESETDSVWTLKGDVGVLARVVRFRVHIREWAGPERVAFELEGLNEPMRGEGDFRMQRYEDAAAGGLVAPRPGLLRRLVEALFRWLFQLRHGRAERAVTADAGPGAGMAKLVFRLRLEPGGPMAPLVNAMVQPALLPFAENLANRIMAHLEAGQAARS